MEGDPDAGEKHINEWERLIKKERDIKSLIKDKLGNCTQEEEPDGGTKNTDKNTSKQNNTTREEEPGGERNEINQGKTNDHNECGCKEEMENKQLRKLMQLMRLIERENEGKGTKNKNEAREMDEQENRW